jgi:hypothetical protein
VRVDADRVAAGKSRAGTKQGDEKAGGLGYNLNFPHVPFGTHL